MVDIRTRIRYSGLSGREYLRYKHSRYKRETQLEWLKRMSAQRQLSREEQRAVSKLSPLIESLQKGKQAEQEAKTQAYIEKTQAKARAETARSQIEAQKKLKTVSMLPSTERKIETSMARFRETGRAGRIIIAKKGGSIEIPKEETARVLKAEAEYKKAEAEYKAERRKMTLRPELYPPRLRPGLYPEPKAPKIPEIQAGKFNIAGVSLTVAEMDKYKGKNIFQRAVTAYKSKEMISRTLSLGTESLIEETRKLSRIRGKEAEIAKIQERLILLGAVRGVTAPFKILRHPIKTAKTFLHPIEMGKGIVKHAYHDPFGTAAEFYTFDGIIGIIGKAAKPVIKPLEGITKPIIKPIQSIAFPALKRIAKFQELKSLKAYRTTVEVGETTRIIREGKALDVTQFKLVSFVKYKPLFRKLIKERYEAIGREIAVVEDIKRFAEAKSTIEMGELTIKKLRTGQTVEGYTALKAISKPAKKAMISRAKFAMGYKFAGKSLIKKGEAYSVASMKPIIEIEGFGTYPIAGTAKLTGFEIVGKTGKRVQQIPIKPKQIDVFAGLVKKTGEIKFPKVTKEIYQFKTERKGGRAYLKQFEENMAELKGFKLELKGIKKGKVSDVIKEQLKDNVIKEKIKEVSIPSVEGKLIMQLKQELAPPTTAQTSRAMFKELTREVAKETEKQAIIAKPSIKIPSKAVKTAKIATITALIPKQKQFTELKITAKQIQAPKLIQKPKQMQLTKQIQISKQIQAPRQITLQKQFSISKTQAKQAQIPKQIQQPKQIQIPRQIQQPKQIQIPRQIQQPKQIQIQRQIQQPKQIQIPKPIMQEMVPPPIIPMQQFKPTRSFVKGFEVFVRRKGKFIKISKKALPEAQAMFKGARYVTQTAAATFFIKESKQLIKDKRYKIRDIGFKFRKKIGKMGETLYIQKERFRIGTAGELEQITFKGIESQKRKTRIKRSMLEMPTIKIW